MQQPTIMEVQLSDEDLTTGGLYPGKPGLDLKDRSLIRLYVGV